MIRGWLAELLRTERHRCAKVAGYDVHLQKVELTMRRLLTIVTTAAVWAGLASFGLADEPAAKPADNKNVQTQVSDTAAQRVEYHRTMAALIEARTAEKPDQAKIDELNGKLQRIRNQLAPQNAEGFWGCPRRGPGYGYGYGGGYGRGWGGRGAGRGQGFGPGAGQGRAPGGPAFVDKDNNGVCDYFEQRNGTQR